MEKKLNAIKYMKLLRDETVKRCGENELPPQAIFDRALDILLKLYERRSDVEPANGHIEFDIYVVIHWRNVSIWVGATDGFGAWDGEAHPFKSVDEIVAQLDGVKLESNSSSSVVYNQQCENLVPLLNALSVSDLIHLLNSIDRREIVSCHLCDKFAITTEHVARDGFMSIALCSKCGENW